MTDEVSDIDLGIDVANAELDDDDLTRVLEALLLVVDTPVTAQTTNNGCGLRARSVREMVSG